MKPDRAEQTLSDLLAELPDTAARLSWLRKHRLLGPADLLAERGLVPADLAALAQAMGRQSPVVRPAQLAEERRVAEALGQSGCDVLVLKGAWMAYRVYPRPEQRWRCDLDVLIRPGDRERVAACMGELGYEPLWAEPGGTPIEQQAWSCRTPEGVRAVDVHWALRNHPLLRQRLQFDEQWQARLALPDLAEGVFGQSSIHALINASMHWFDNLYDSPRPLGWILDIDLLWRAMSTDERAGAVTLAIERDVAVLLADNLARARRLFDTPVDDEVLAVLRQGLVDDRVQRLIDDQGRPVRLYWLALRSEPGVRAAVRRIRAGLFPPREHMRARYPDLAERGLWRLYLHRIVSRLRSVFGGAVPRQQDGSRG